MELWLGEAKFYEDFKAAAKSVVDELAKHTETNYLRDEFLLIRGKVDSSWPHAKQLEELLADKRSVY
jgi:hypothetical protein